MGFLAELDARTCVHAEREKSSAWLCMCGNLLTTNKFIKKHEGKAQKNLSRLTDRKSGDSRDED